MRVVLPFSCPCLLPLAPPLSQLMSGLEGSNLQELAQALAGAFQL